MIISVEKAKSLIDFKGWSDEKVAMKLEAIEQTIRAYTNNKFQNRAYRKTADIVGGLLVADFQSLFKVGDTIEISEARLNAGLYSVTGAADNSISVTEDLVEEKSVLVTKIEYPADVVQCALNLLEWAINNRAKGGIQSETLSRHSVTYFAQDANNQVMGYPVSLMGGLKAHRKVRC